MMEILSWMIIGFAAIQLIVAFVNVVSQPRFHKKSDADDLVSVLIPARNEEQNISNLLTDLQHQTYKNLEILVFDDQSTDRTAELVSDMAKYDNRIRLITSTGLPESWLGKNYACHSLAQQASGKYLLFLDADVRAEQLLISRTIRYSKKRKMKLLSIFPTQKMHSMGEKAVVPIMNYILLTLLPLVLVLRSKFSSLAAANGQFMLFEAKAYKKLNPHELLKAEKVEDIKIAQLFKKQHLKVACVSNNNDVSCRMYTNYNESIEGFSKNIVMFFGNSYLLAFAFWLVTTFGFIVVLVALPLKFFILLNVIAIVTRIFVSIASNQNSIQNLLFLIPQQLNIGIILFKSIINKKNKAYQWKGRVVE
jgi:glycosyltransferase involved in cell wall biosynthesis